MKRIAILILTCIALGGCLEPQAPAGPDAGTCGEVGEKCCPDYLSPDGEIDWCAAELACSVHERGICDEPI